MIPLPANRLDLDVPANRVNDKRNDLLSSKSSNINDLNEFHCTHSCTMMFRRVTDQIMIEYL